MDKGIWIIGGITTILVIVGIILFSANDKMNKLSSSFKGADGEIVSEQGIHWHPELTIVIKGQKQEVSANIGIGPQNSTSKWYDPMMQMTDIHTHDNSGTLHWEVMAGPVKRGHVKLGAFFEIWGKPFSKNQIFDNKSGNGGMVKMTVNGQPNTDFENYIVKDKDKIEISYE